jgi:hypothetical protein
MTGKKDERPQVDAGAIALTRDDVQAMIDAALELRERQIAEQAAAEKKAAADAAVAAQRRAAADQKRAARAVEDAAIATEKKRMAAVDRAKREYASIVAEPIATALAIADAASIELRFGDGATFMPGFEIGGIRAADLPEEGGRAVLNVPLAVPRESVGFAASEALLILEGGSAGEPLAVFRAEMVPPVRLGGGVLAEFPAGSFAFRRLSPLPQAAAA